MSEQAKDIWPVDLAENHYELSYRIIHESPPLGGPNKLKDALKEINREVREHVWTGWSMFYPFSKEEIEPQILFENENASGCVILETDLRKHRFLETTLPDYWRVSENGYAILIRPYREDRIGLVTSKVDPNRKPGEWLSPETPIRETAEFVRHAYLFSKKFPSASQVEFICVWKGLSGRHFAGFGSEYWSANRICKTPTRRTEGRFPVSDLISKWQEVVVYLACPVLQLFDFDNCDKEFVSGMEEKFRKLPPDVE